MNVPVFVTLLSVAPFAMTVSGDPVDRFGLSAFVARCVSRLTEGAQSEIAL